MAPILLLALLWLPPARAGWVDLFNRKNLDGWEVIGDGIWTVMRDGTLVGQRDLSRRAPKWEVNQSWLYTRREFGEYDLHVEWWTRRGGNSGVSIRDTSRARWAWGEQSDKRRTPSHIGYEIQISNEDKDPYPSGSVYLLDRAKTGFERADDWNTFDIEVRDNLIRVRLNGQPVSQHAGDPERPKSGPIGLQLHDRNSFAMFRSIRIREIKAANKPR